MLKQALQRMHAIFSQSILTRGQSIQQRGGVLSVRLSDGLVKGSVKDNTKQLVTVYLDLKKWPNSPTLCSCSLRHNCEHAVACLIQLSGTPLVISAQDEKHLIETLPIALTAEWVERSTNHKTGLHLEADQDAQEFFVTLNNESNDYFAYELGILIEGESINLVPLLVQLLNKYSINALNNLQDHEKLALKVVSARMKKIISIPWRRIKPIVAFLQQYGTKSVNSTSRQLSLSRAQLTLLETEEWLVAMQNVNWRSGQSLLKNIKMLFEPIEAIDETELCVLQLRPYQIEGIQWLQKLRKSQLGGILADDMGLGKTVQTLAHLQLEKKLNRLKTPCLIVAPTSVIMNWYQEAQRYTPILTVIVLQSIACLNNKKITDYDLVLTSYGLVQRNCAYFMKQKFYYVVLDEAQFIKNARTKTAQVMQAMPAQHRLCLTGTPLENNLSELWSLFNFLVPGFLGTIKQFNVFFKKPIEKDGDIERLTLLTQRITPFLLRRTKNQVAKELPEKTEIVKLIQLTSFQRDLYEIIRVAMEKKVRTAIAAAGIQMSRIVILEALLKLRQVCCDPRLIKDEQQNIPLHASAKLNSLIDLVQELVAEQRRVLIFSQFTSMLVLIELELQAKNINYLKLTGQTRNRHSLVETFQQGHIPVFLISLKAGGTGLNLTAADTVIHYDPWWNPAVETQATDRSHRIGQHRPVFVYKLICSGTVEEVIMHLQHKKKLLAEDILSNKCSPSYDITEHDINNLFHALP